MAASRSLDSLTARACSQSILPVVPADVGLRRQATVSPIREPALLSQKGTQGTTTATTIHGSMIPLIFLKCSAFCQPASRANKQQLSL